MQVVRKMNNSRTLKQFFCTENYSRKICKTLCRTLREITKNIYLKLQNFFCRLFQIFKIFFCPSMIV